MINIPYRCLFVLLSMSPITIGIFCAGVTDWKGVFTSLILGLFCCSCAVVIFKFWLRKVLMDQEPLPQQFESISKKKSSSSSYFVAYVLPILLGGSISVWAIALLIIIFFLLSLFLEAEENNPIVRILGYSFYEITNKEGVTVLLMSKMNIRDLSQLKNKGLYCIWFDDAFCIQKEC